MASRYPTVKVVDYCLNPLHLKDLDKDVVVPCGKCAGCRLHAANVWSMRLGMEIENNPYSIFVTPTYNNYYLPRLVPVAHLARDKLGNILYRWSSNHNKNWRCARSRSSLRKDDIELLGSYDFVPVTNDQRHLPCIPYVSKNDIQLYFKLIRKYLQDEKCKSKDGRFFRYFAISEYGETLYRPHYHIIFFPLTSEVFERFLYSGCLFENWQMCDEDLFNDNIKSCNSGTRNYLTQYVNSFTRLPEVYKNDEIRPFRLSSKGPAIGFSKFDVSEIFENLSIGVADYSRSIPRLQAQYVLCYPKAYLSSIFPKCKGYSRKSYDALLRTYGAVYKLRRFKIKSVYDTAYHRLSESMCSSDFNAARKCDRVIQEYNESHSDSKMTVWHYVFLLDMYYYKTDMMALKLMYEYESVHSSLENLRLYNNFGEYVLKLRNGSCTNSEILMLDYFCESFGISSLDLMDIDLSSLVGSSRPNQMYVSELADILHTMVKMPKVYETLGVSPVNQTI